MDFNSLIDTDDPALNYVVTHVFFPPEIPKENDYTIQNELSLARAVCIAAHAYSAYIDDTFRSQWDHIIQMLDNLQTSVQSGHVTNDDVTSQLGSMQSGNIFAYLLRGQNAAVIFRRQKDCTLYESFEVSASHEAVRNTAGRLVYLYAEKAIAIPNKLFDNIHFQTELANFLSLPGKADLDPPNVPSAHPEYVTALLAGILRSVGHIIEGTRVLKHVRDEIGDLEGKGAGEWRRSSLWLLIRLAIQTSLDRSPLGQAFYKAFVLFFICNLATDANNANLSSNLLHLMSAKILRRLSKLGPSTPYWLSDMAIMTSTCLQNTLEARRTEMEAARPPSLSWSSSELDLFRDIQLSLPHIDRYIRDALENHGHKPGITTFDPPNYYRGTLEDFLSPNTSFFNKAYDVDPYATLYDVEQSVERGIDQWLVRVTNVDEACSQVGMLMDIYLSRASVLYTDNPEHRSIMTLTALELWVALDKLVVEEIPIVAEYTPEIPIRLLESLLLREPTSLQRLSYVYQYLLARHTRSRAGLSVLSNEFAEDSFPIRYYDSSPELQSLRAHIGLGLTWGALGGELPEQGTANRQWVFTSRDDESQPKDQHGIHQQLAEGGRLLIGASPLYSKLVVFELQCPTSIRIWRSSIAHILYRFDKDKMKPFVDKHGTKRRSSLYDFPELRPYLAEDLCHELPTHTQFYFACFRADGFESHQGLKFGYAFKRFRRCTEFSTWQATGDGPMSQHTTYSDFYSSGVPSHDLCLTEESRTISTVARCVHNGSLTSNDVLSAQADCPLEFSLDEFIAHGQLRCGGSLQWINILRELCDRTLNFHSREAYFLLAQATSQVGTLDVNTREWLWHRELQSAYFCNELLDELHTLFLDVSTGSLDEISMRTIIMVLSRILASSPSESISERILQLLRSVRKKTLEWVQEIAYNLILEPMNEERRQHLYYMASTCRSTFDVDTSSLSKVLQSAEDVEALLSCAFFVQAANRVPSPRRCNQPNCDFGHFTGSSIYEHARLLYQRDRRLSVAIEAVLRNAIHADITDRGIDLAVRSIWPEYQPGPGRWKPEEYPNSHWLGCTTAATADGRSQVVRINLIDHSLLVDGRPLIGLPREIREHPLYDEIFDGKALLVIPSDVSGMDLATLTMISDHRVYFSLRGDDLVIRARHKDTRTFLQLVPPEKLNGVLPTFLLQGHIHWLDLSTSAIEIYPLKNIWDRSPENWKIEGTHGRYRVYKGCDYLLDMQSQTWSMVSSLLEGLDLRENLIATIRTGDTLSMPRLTVALPRHGLSFFVNDDGNLESADFKEMVYDENQYVGTLFGLANRLVLKAKGNFEYLPRYVLIPSHPFKTSGQNVPRSATYYAYKVDTELGCLIGNSSLESREFLAYVHTKTSIDWRPDPLTGRTGIQEAFSILSSAGCQSLLKFDTNPRPRYRYSKDISSGYPQIIIAYAGESQIYFPKSPLTEVELADLKERSLVWNRMRCAGRSAYLFPPIGATPTSPGKEFDLHHAFSLIDTELEDVAYTAAHMIYCHRLDEVSIASWVEVWGSSMSDSDSDNSASQSPSPYDGKMWNSNLPEVLSAKVHDIFRGHDDARRQFQLLFLLPAMAYCSSHPQTAFLSMLLAFVQTHTAQYRMGDCSDYKLLYGYCPTEKALRNQVSSYQTHGKPTKRHSEWISVGDIVKCLLRAWPSDTIPNFSLDPGAWDVVSLTTALQAVFSNCYRNLKLKEDLTRILREFSHLHAGTTSIRTLSASYGIDSSLPSTSYSAKTTPRDMSEEFAWQITLDRLLSKAQAPTLPQIVKLPSNVNSDAPGGLEKRWVLPDQALATPGFKQLFSSLRMSEGDPPFQEQYIACLHTSTRYAREDIQSIRRTTKGYPVRNLREHFMQTKRNYMDACRILQDAFDSESTPFEEALSRGGQWPQVTAYTLLQCLASASPIKLSQTWKDCLISFALLLLECQRSRRLLQFSLEGFEEEFTKELENEGCDGWNAEQHPDWLLIQLQGNFLIRREQVNIATEMIYPQSGRNTIMQVGVGEGKSSVIIPIIAATLADGHRLVRVIVPKALTVQMLYCLVDRLGGITNRPIYRLFFYRSKSLDKRSIEALHREVARCIDECGTMIAQPEDVLSLKLTSVEGQLPEYKVAIQLTSKIQKSIHGSEHDVVALSLKFFKDSYLANIFRRLSSSLQCSITTQQGTDNVLQGNVSRFLELQKFLHSRYRDILDESDEILHPQRQLIYTIGYPQHMDGFPDRWTAIQKVLRLVRQHAFSLSQDLPDSVEYASRQPGSFPHFRILRTSDAGRRLILLLVEDVMADQLPAFSFRLIDQTQRYAIRDFITLENIQSRRAREVEEYAKRVQQSNLWSGLLQLRGLFAHNILLFAITERRWRVDYGLSDGRSSECTMLAIPYRAKDVPAPNSQFGHPDITILLTCLSYYYTGLDEKQLRVSFQILLGQDNPATEYGFWVQDCDSVSLPPSLRKLTEFNLQSSEQWDNHLFPTFRYSQAVIDFYLSHVVFPKEAKEYPWKIAASSWDLAEKREHLTTGFSGTSDARHLLPTSITQHELNSQQGMSARVLGYLLQPENDSYCMLAARGNGQQSKALDFLKTVVAEQPEIRVFLDVGAQILDISNHGLAEEWLKLTSVDGAIYFDTRDNLMILTRDGTIQPLVSSPLVLQLHRCVVYLDDAHTRGTDLRFPQGFRAAVTLGPKVTKDRLVQGCMRMRKLGHGHSVMFFAPLEVDQSIRSITNKEDRNIRITTADILKWAIHETWTDIRQRAPYWAQQGMSHKTRYDTWNRFCANEITSEKLADAWLQPEMKSLADLYAPCESQSASGSTLSKLETDIDRHCEFLGVARSSIHTSALDEQLERQVDREIEREREVELPPEAEPAAHFLHPDVQDFVKTGVLRTSSAFRPVFTSLEKSSAVSAGTHSWSPFILATADFYETIKHVPTNGRVDQYLRPVQWVLSGYKDANRVLVVVSPYEADLLMPDIRLSKYVHLHVYTPRTSMRMKPMDNLKLYTIPPLPENWTPPWDLIDQLNVFAGQVYLRDWDAYLRLAKFLDVQKKPSKGKASWYNLFHAGSRKEFERAHPDSLLPSVMMLLAIRRRGLPFSDTHMGKILQGRPLTGKDFECPEPNGSNQNSPPLGQMQLNTLSRSPAMDYDEEDDLLAVSPVASRVKRGFPDTDNTLETDSGRPEKRLRIV